MTKVPLLNGSIALLTRIREYPSVNRAPPLLFPELEDSLRIEN